MRNEEKHALRRELRRARAQMGHQGRLAAGQTVNRLLKRYIKKGRKIGVYWPMGSELRLDGFVRAAQKRGAKLYLPYIEPRSRRMWFTPYPADGVKQEHKRGNKSAAAVYIIRHRIPYSHVIKISIFPPSRCCEYFTVPFWTSCPLSASMSSAIKSAITL